MSELALSKFYDALDALIEEQFPQGTRYSPERLVGVLQTGKYKDIRTELSPILEALGLRALLRRHRSKRTGGESHTQEELWAGVRIKKRVAVPYLDDQGKQRWDSKSRVALEIDEAEEVLKKWNKQPTKSRDKSDWEKMLRAVRPYRNQTNSVAEALAMAKSDGLNLSDG